MLDNVIDPNTRITHCFIVREERTEKDESVGKLFEMGSSLLRSSLIGGGHHMLVSCLLEEPIAGEYPYLIVETYGKKFIWLAKSWNDRWVRSYGFELSKINYDTKYPPKNSKVSGMKYIDVVSIYKELKVYGLTTNNCDDQS